MGAPMTVGVRGGRGVDDSNPEHVCDVQGCEQCHNIDQNTNSSCNSSTSTKM